jgi:hypothetical protein
MTLIITVNKKLASQIGREESELCLLISKAIISKVIITIVVVSKNNFKNAWFLSIN